MNGVLVPLFAPEKAPGIRDGIRQLAEWRLNEVEEGWGLVEPAEGGGTTRTYFKLHKLCDASTLIDEATWEPVRKAPAFDKTGLQARTSPLSEPTADWKEPLGKWVTDLLRHGRRGAELVAIQAKMNSLPSEEVPEYLTEQAPAIFEAFPEGSIWLLETDVALSRRMSILRILLNQELVPDVFDSAQSPGELVGLEMLQEHSLTGATFASLLDPALLAFPPGALGYSIDWMPHGLVILFGGATFIGENQPPTFASIYAPRMHAGYGFHWRDMKVWEDLTPATAETLIQWWITRLNLIYSYTCDPTRFADQLRRFQPSRQTAWQLTFERMLADWLVIASNPQTSALALHQAAFDLLDKAEVLLGYGSDRTGDGFRRLLTRGEMVSRLNRKWDARLPLQLRPRLKAYTADLYDRFYEEIREEAYDHRLTAKGVNVWSSREGRLIDRQMDDYAPKVVRAIRNSAHGLVEQLESPKKEKERNLVATHTGQLPAVLPDLAGLIAFALVADAEGLCSGTWLD